LLALTVFRSINERVSKSYSGVSARGSVDGGLRKIRVAAIFGDKISELETVQHEQIIS
jgi:hypothetical protein